MYDGTPASMAPGPVSSAGMSRAAAASMNAASRALRKAYAPCATACLRAAFFTSALARLTSAPDWNVAAVALAILMNVRREMLGMLARSEVAGRYVQTVSNAHAVVALQPPYVRQDRRRPCKRRTYFTSFLLSHALFSARIAQRVRLDASITTQQKIFSC